MLAIVLLVVLGLLRLSDQVNATISGCCDMESGSDPCAWVGPEWKWSITNGPPVTGSLYPGFASGPPGLGYFYLQDNAGGILDSTANIYIPNQYTIINLDYYYNTPNPSPDSYLNIYFIPQGSSNRMLISDTNIPIDNWVHKDIPCNYKNNFCCGLQTKFPCYGTIEVIGSLGIVPPVGLLAVDNIGTCETTPPACCRFQSSDACGFTNVVSNTQDWAWSISPPVNPPPPPAGASYVYFELVNSATGTIIDSAYRSGLVTIPENVDFTGNFYIVTPYGNAGDSGLRIDFVDSYSGKRSEMTYIKTTYGAWAALGFSCNAAVNNCCNGFNTCAGWIEFVAHVDYPGGTVLYAVDYIAEQGTACP